MGVYIGGNDKIQNCIGWLLRKAGLTKTKSKEMKYMVIEEDLITRFEARVNEAIKKGYEPLGGMSVVEDKNNGGFIFFQAMADPTPPTIQTSNT